MVTEKNSAGAGENHQRLVDSLRRFDTIEALRNSDEYGRHATYLHRLFGEPRVYEAAGARPRLKTFLRVVEWNIERGSRLDGVVETLNSHPVLRHADLLLLNELDCGMARSGNRNVARELADALGAHAVYGVEYLEFTKGVGDELDLREENTTALHGNAILTRHPFSGAQVFRLPRCEDNFASAEKRMGGRVGILIDLALPGGRMLVGNTHLDVVNTPRCRARQIRALLEAIQARAREAAGANGGALPVLVGGDLNTHTFARGGRWRTLRNAARILGNDPEKLARDLLEPETREPALGEFLRFGYDLEGMNDRSATGYARIVGLDDASRLPGPVKKWAMRRLGPGGVTLDLRLDWLASRSMRALKADELVDSEAGVASIEPQTFRGLTYQGEPISDHDPIAADIVLGRN